MEQPSETNWYERQPSVADYPIERTAEYGRDMLVWLRYVKEGRGLSEAVGALAHAMTRQIESHAELYDIESPAAHEPIIGQQGAFTTTLSMRRHPHHQDGIELEPVQLQGTLDSFYAGYEGEIETIFARVDTGIPERMTTVGRIRPLWSVPIERAIVRPSRASEEEAYDRVYQMMLRLDLDDSMRFKQSLVVGALRDTFHNPDSTMKGRLAAADAVIKVVCSAGVESYELRVALQDYIERHLKVGAYRATDTDITIDARRHHYVIPTEVVKASAPGGAQVFSGIAPYLDAVAGRPVLRFYTEGSKEVRAAWVALEDIDELRYEKRISSPARRE